MREDFPDWRIDNTIPIIGLVLALVVNVGAIFWWSGRVDIKLEQVIASQAEQKKMLSSLIDRIVREEKISSVVLNILKLDIK